MAEVTSTRISNRTLTLEEARQWARSLERPPKYAYKNSMRVIGGLIRSGRAQHGRYTIPISAKQAFQTHQSMGGRKMAPLYKDQYRVNVDDTKRRIRRATDVDVNKPLYRRARVKGRGGKRRVVAKAVDTLYRIITKKGFSHRGGKHVEFFKGGAEPEMKFGGSGILPSVHHFGQIRTIKRQKRGPVVIAVPPRPVLEVTPQLATAAANIMADETMKLIGKGYF